MLKSYNDTVTPKVVPTIPTGTTVLHMGTRTVQIREDSISIHLPQRIMDAAWSAAEKASAHYTAIVQVAKAPYGSNEPLRHYFGKVGEYGAHYLFGRLGPVLGFEIPMDAVFMDDARDAACDIVVNGVRIEIKCWRPSDYVHFGPCIAERQAKKLHKKCDVIVYATYDTRSSEYVLRGWNYVHDVDGIEPVLTGRVGKQVLNRQMKPRMMSTLPILSSTTVEHTISSSNISN